MKRYRKYCLAFSLLLLMAIQVNAQIDPRFTKTYVDDDTKFTTTGSIGLTVTNFGTFGDGFAIQSPFDQPSCEYPKGSGIEHIFVGGLWVGGKRDNGTILVTTGARDIPSLRDVAAGLNLPILTTQTMLPSNGPALSTTAFFHQMQSVTRILFLTSQTQMWLFRVPPLEFPSTHQ